MAKEKLKEAKTKKKRKWPWVVVAVLILAGIGSASKEEAEVEESEIEVVAEQESEKIEIEPNTTAMVDDIVSRAKADADGHLDLDTCKEALAYLNDNYPNYFENNEVMEQVMYYGAFLEYSFEGKGLNDDVANLGMDALQSVKYVYRNVESIEDTATQENLQQVKEGLEIVDLG